MAAFIWLGSVMPSAAAAASAEDEPAVVAAFVANVEDDADVANALV